MLLNSDCRFTRGYYIGHPCRDFRRPCPCNAGSSLPGLYHIMGTSGTLAPANKIDGAQVNQLRQGFVDQGLNLSGAPMHSNPNRELAVKVVDEDKP